MLLVFIPYTNWIDLIIIILSSACTEEEKNQSRLFKLCGDHNEHEDCCDYN